MKKAIITLLTTASLIFGAWHLGYVEPLYLEDQTYITYVITALWALALACWFAGKKEITEYISNTLTTLGLLGTLLGIKIATSGQALDDHTVQSLGVSSAINTTILGIVCSLYLDTFMRMIRRVKKG